MRFLPRVTERRDRKSDRIQFLTESQYVRQPYDVRTISSRHMQGCRRTVMQNLQKCRKTNRYVVRSPYDVRMISSRHMQGCRKTVMQNLQDCRKTKRYVVRSPHCSRAVIVRFSVVVVRFVAFLRQPCDKAQVHLAIVLRLA